MKAIAAVLVTAGIGALVAVPTLILTHDGKADEPVQQVEPARTASVVQDGVFHDGWATSVKDGVELYSLGGQEDDPSAISVGDVRALAAGGHRSASYDDPADSLVQTRAVGEASSATLGRITSDNGNLTTCAVTTANTSAGSELMRLYASHDGLSSGSR
jgi:hypothetical protein